MPLSAGDQLGSYEILAPLGAGGEVYRAKDSVGQDFARKFVLIQDLGRVRAGPQCVIA